MCGYDVNPWNAFPGRDSVFAVVWTTLPPVAMIAHDPPSEDEKLALSRRESAVEAVLVALPVPDKPTCAFKSAGRYGWIFACRLGVVRTVLMIPLALALWGAWLVRPRWPACCCQRCGYERAGIAADAKCPECGASPTSV